MGSMKALNLGGSWLARQLKNRHSDKGDLPVLSVSPDLRKPFYLGVFGYSLTVGKYTDMLKGRIFTFKKLVTTRISVR